MFVACIRTLGLLIALAALVFVVACEPGPSATPKAATPAAAPAEAVYSPGGAAAPSTGMGYEGPFGFGRVATKQEIDAWNIDVAPDGQGAPPGSGTPAQGAPIFLNKCSTCHGGAGEGEGSFPALVKPFNKNDPRFPQFPRTIGNYWPYATTVYDYIRRAMPFDMPGSLTADEVYALTAWLLNKNAVIGDNDALNAENLAKVEMPAKKFFKPFWPQFYRP